MLILFWSLCVQSFEYFWSIFPGVSLTHLLNSICFCMLWALWYWWTANPKLSERAASPGYPGAVVPMGPSWVMDSTVSGPVRRTTWKVSVKCMSISSSRLAFLPELWYDVQVRMVSSDIFALSGSSFPPYLQMLLPLKIQSRCQLLENLSWLFFHLPNLS